MMGSESFAEYAHEAVVRAVRKIDQAVRDDVYVISLFVYDEQDDPRRPTTTVGFNTGEQVAAMSTWASSMAEARWNYAFWLQNELAIIANTQADPHGAALRETWIKDELGLWYDDEPVEFDVRGEPITASYVSLMVALSLRVHRENLIRETFGRVLPVLIHELEYYDEIGQQNIEANPPGVVPDEFLAWCRGEF